MAYVVKFQTESAYKNIKYGQGTVYSSACGCASLCNCLKVLGIADVSVPTMCAYSVSVGARVVGGTDEYTLLKNASAKYGFTWETTSKNAELLEHLKSGGVAILHAGNQHQLFSSSGHFVAAVAASGETITVLDSYWYSGKYTSTSLRRNNVTVVSKGVIKTSLSQCGKATIDRSPSYYLISKKPVIKEDDEVVTKTKFCVNGKSLSIDAINKDGNTYANLRELCAILGMTVDYNSDTKERVINLPNVEIAVDNNVINVKGAFVNGDTHLASVGKVLRDMGYTVNSPSPYHITAKK